MMTTRKRVAAGLMLSLMGSVVEAQETFPIQFSPPAGPPPAGTADPRTAPPGLLPPPYGEQPGGTPPMGMQPGMNQPGGAQPFGGQAPYGAQPFGGQAPFGGQPYGVPQDASPFAPPGTAPFAGPAARPFAAPPPAPFRDMSWIYVNSPPPRKVKVHDIITIIVSEQAEVTQDARFNRQRNATLKAQLQQFVRIDGNGNLAPSNLDQPAINGILQSKLQSLGTAASREGMRWRIAATVAEVLPNGTLILEARKSIRTNRDLWEESLTGRIRSEDVAGNNTVLSENIAELRIIKTENGKIRDSAKRGLLMTLYDWLLPF